MIQECQLRYKLQSVLPEHEVPGKRKTSQFEHIFLNYRKSVHYHFINPNEIINEIIIDPVSGNWARPSGICS